MEVQPTDFNWFDISVITIVSISTIFAMFRGFIKTCFSLATWVGAGVLTALFYNNAREIFGNVIENPNLVFAAASFGMFLVFFIFLAIISAYLTNLVGNIKGGVIDRSLGFCFGFLRGVLLICIVFFTTNAVSKALSIGDEEKPGPEWFTSAKTYNTLRVVSDLTVSLLPEGSVEHMISYIDSVKDIALKKVGGASLDDEEKSDQNKTLSPQDRKVMTKIIASIPKSELYRINKKHRGNSEKMTEEIRVAMFQDIFEAYLKAASSGEIKEEEIVSEADLENLKSILNKAPTKPKQNKNEEETGYKELNIKQLNRLVGTLSE